MKFQAPGMPDVALKAKDPVWYSCLLLKREKECSHLDLALALWRWFGDEKMG